MTTDFKHKITLTREFKDVAVSGQNKVLDETNVFADAVITQLASIPSVPSFTLGDNGMLIADTLNLDTEIKKDVFARVLEIRRYESGKIFLITLCVMSDELDAVALTGALFSLREAYLNGRNPDLQGRTFVFEQKLQKSNPCLDFRGEVDGFKRNRAAEISMAPQHVVFTKTPFHSSKNFSNVYGEAAQEVIRRIRLFVDKKEWYQKTGIPYQFGAVLSGEPGTGKTSLVRATAAELGLSIVNVNFNMIKTATQLKNLFFSDYIMVYLNEDDRDPKKVRLPIDQRLLVLDDLDAITNIVMDRSMRMYHEDEEEVEDQLTLGTLLTTFDGTREMAGRKMFITGNHLENLDPALIRPGRIDLKVHLTNASSRVLATMYTKFTGRPFPEKLVEELPHEILSPAEVEWCLFADLDATAEQFVKRVRDYEMTK